MAVLCSSRDIFLAGGGVALIYLLSTSFSSDSYLSVTLDLRLRLTANSFFNISSLFFSGNF